MYFNKTKNLLISAALCLFLLLLPNAGSASNDADNDFMTIRKMLISDGYDKDSVAALYNAPEVLMDLDLVKKFFIIRESKVNYDQFTAPELIRKALIYLNTHKKSFDAAENIYGVSRYVIAAILLVETKLGTYLGGYPVLSSLSSIASLTNPDIREAIWKRIAHRGDYTKDEFTDRALKKATWAYSELKEFLSFTIREKKNPLEIYGSYAGALGICQFLPSNVRSLAVDGNYDGIIDLFNHADAIASVGNYLKYHGWQPTISEKQASQVIYKYNNSTYYVNTILTAAKLIKGGK